MTIPIVQIAMKIPSSLGFTALRSIIIDGRESVINTQYHALTAMSIKQITVFFGFGFITVHHFS